MSNAPGPFTGPRLIRASIAGVALAIFGILAFILLWVVLGNAGFTNVTRLFVSLCAPPVVIAVLLGGYMMLFQRRNRS